MAYHHGDARAALLRASAKLLEQQGAARLSLRHLAEHAGLSRQAPYNHFANKEALLAELVRSGYRALAAQMIGAGTDTPSTERLAAAAESYIAFGIQQPALFRLMFSSELVDLCKYPAAQEAARTALGGLSEIVATLDPTSDTSDATLVAWSLVHGYTNLCIETGLEAPEERRKRALLFAHTVEALVHRTICSRNGGN